MARLNIERQHELEPKRIQYAINKINELGIIVTEKDNSSIKFFHKGEVITLFPYSGWFSGKGIVAGRGLDNLLKQLTEQNKK